MDALKIDINDILRFTGIGIFIIFILGLENCAVLPYLKEFGIVSVVLFGFLLGNIFYYIYRSLIYSTFILKIKDRFLKDQKYYTRSYFKSELGCSSTKSANEFFYFLRSKCDLKGLTKESSSVHLMYMTSIILIIYMFYKIYLLEFWPAALLFTIGLITMLAAFLTDRTIEKYDYHQVRNIEDIDKYWNEFVESKGGSDMV